MSDLGQIHDATAGNSFNPRLYPTGHVAFEVSRDRLREWLTMANDSEEQLLGLFIEFAEKRSNGDRLLLSEMRVVQLVVNTQTNELYRRPLDRGFDYSTDAKRVYEETAGLGRVLKYTLRDEDFRNHTNLHRRLEFFNSDIDLVFLGTGEVELLSYYYTTVVFSGAELELGNKLSPAERGAGNQLNRSDLYQDHYFTLKVEGKDYAPEPGVAYEAEAAQEIPLSSFYAPPSCPPEWFLTSDIAARCRLVIPDFSVKWYPDLLRNIRGLLTASTSRARSKRK